MSPFALPDDLAGRSAAELAFRLCASGSPDEVRPFWADGGRSQGEFSPGRHLLAAHPTRVGEIRVETLPFRGLANWLRTEPRLATQRDGLLALGLSYDAGRSMERIATLAETDPILPDVVFAEYPAYIHGDSENGPWELWATDRRAAEELINTLRFAPSSPSPLIFTHPFAERTRWEEYEDAIQTVLRAIQAGDLYQANIARRIEAPMPAEQTPILYMRMRESNPSAFGTLWCIGKESWIASSSPECLFTYDVESRTAKSYPIKGTRRRGRTPIEDEVYASELGADPKELAEHVMIVDLVRNDLGRVSAPGSVKVSALAKNYRLPTVHHLVSDIEGTLSSSHDLVDLLLALFPGGSITGAPKIAAMQKIEEVERVRRGFYTGSVGLIEPDGSANFNILIRTCVAHRGMLYYQTGGGIVADSTAQKEWDETCAKAHALTSLVNDLDRGRSK